MNEAALWGKTELDVLKKRSCRLQIAAKHIIFKENDETDNVYFIESGHIKHYHNTSLGKIIIVSVCGPQEMIGIPAVLLGHTRGVFAETIDKCTVWSITKKDFCDILYANPKLTIKMMGIYCQYVRNYEYSIQGLLAADVSSRLAWLLLRIASNVQQGGSQRCVIDFRITHQEMADMIGSCRQTVTAVLGHFQQNGWIGIGKNLIEIRDVKELYKIAV